MTESIESDVRRQQIDAICANIVQQLRQGQNKQAIASLRRALERYPDNARLRGLHSQIQQKVKASKIKKLEYEAMVLIQKGAESEGQKKLREIYQLDPNRTDLKDAVEKKLREETQQDFHVSMRKQSVRNLCLTWISAITFVAGLSAAIAGWSNTRHLAKAREHIDSGAYQLAVTELNDCGWLMAGDKPLLRAELAKIEADSRAEAEARSEQKEYTKAIAQMQKAMSASQFPEDYQETLQNLKKLQQNERDACTAAMHSQQDCLTASRRASESKAEADAASLWEQAKTISDDAERLLAAEEYIQAREAWLKAIALFDDAATTAAQVQSDRADAKAARQHCLQKTSAAQKMNAQLEASSEWAQASDLAAAAENLFEQRNYVQAKQTWRQSSDMFDAAVEISRRSPSYNIAMEHIAKWRDLHLQMSEKAVTSLLGEPVCRIAETHQCVMYYQDLPELLSSRKNSSGPTEPTAGYIMFENKGKEFAEANARQVYEKTLSAENRRYEADLKRSQKLAQESTRIPGQQNPRTRNRNTGQVEQAIRSTHQENLRKIESDYAVIRRNLIEGITPINPVYLSAQWVAPEPNNIVPLVAAALPTPAVPAEKWQSPENWQKLKLNMEHKYVENLLGNLLGVGITTDKSYQLGNIQGFGQLRFVRGKDGEPRLVYWKEPFWPAIRAPETPADNLAGADHVTAAEADPPKQG